MTGYPSPELVRITPGDMFKSLIDLFSVANKVEIDIFSIQ